jgi:hypothetical protein
MQHLRQDAKDMCDKTVSSKARIRPENGRECKYYGLTFKSLFHKTQGNYQVYNTATRRKEI